LALVFFSFLGEYLFPLRLNIPMYPEMTPLSASIRLL